MKTKRMVIKKGLWLFLIISFISISFASAEVIERGANWNKYSNVSVTYYPREVNYWNETNWIPKDLTIIPSTRSGYDYAIIKGYYKVFLKNNSNTDSAVRFEKDGYFFTYDLSGGQMLWRATPTQPDASNTLGSGAPSNSQNTQVSIDLNNANYSNAFYNTDVIYTLQLDVLKEIFILKGLPSYKDYLYLEYSGNIKFNKTLDICNETNCFTPSGSQDDFETSGKIYFKNSSGSTIFYLTEPIIIDSNGTQILGIYKVHGSNAQMNFYLRINKTFLENAVFPVYIDPSVKIGEENGGADAYISSAFPNTNYGSIDELDVKWLNSGAKLSSYVKFNISSIPNNQVIDNSLLCLYMFSDTSSHNISAYHVYADWSESSVTWNNQPCGTNFDNNTNCNLTAESNLSNDGTQDDTWQCWNVTDMIGKQYAKNKGDISIVLRTKTNLNAMDKFYSKEYSDSSLWPYLNITYHLADAIPPSLTIISPLNQSYGTNLILVNISAQDANLALIWWFNGSTNLTYGSPTFYNFQQGSNTITAYANDTAGNLNSTSVTFYIDSVAPSINIIEPEAKTYFSNSSLSLNFSVYDLNLQSCWYNIDNGQNISLQNCQNSTFNVSIDKSYILNFYANDSFGNINFMNRSFSINTRIAIALESPLDNAWLNYEEIEFKYKVDTASLIKNCSLWFNNGLWHLNQTNSSQVNTTGGINKFGLNLSDGSYSWNVLCTDTYSAFALNNFTLNMDSQSPSLAINSPLNNSFFVQNVSIPLNFSVYDANLQSCWYSLNGLMNYSVGCANENNNLSFNYPAGNYNLTLFANDSAGNLASFIIYNLTIEQDSIAPFLAIDEPKGTKTSRTNIPLKFSVSDNDIISECWYNFTSFDGTITKANTAISNCQNSSFDVSVDTNYMLYLSSRDRTGNFNSINSNFSVSTSTPVQPPINGGGGGGGGTSINATKEQAGIEISGITDMVAKPGEIKTLSASVKNTGKKFLNNCRLRGEGENSNWISSKTIKGLSPGEVSDFIFTVSLPNDFVADTDIVLQLKCDEAETLKKFEISLARNSLEVSIKSVVQDGKNLRFVYSLAMTEEGKVFVEYSVTDNKGNKIVEGNNSVDLKDKADIEGNLQLPDNIAGEYTLNIKASSQTASSYTQESILLGEKSGFLGRAILVAGGTKIVSIALIIVLSVLVMAIVIKRIIKKSIHEDKTGYVKLKLAK